MSVRIGLAVAIDSVRMVAVRDEHILWAGESPVDVTTPLERAVEKLLAEIRLPRWPRPRVVAAIGPAQAQVKRLTGLPPVSDARVVARLVQESPGRFFLRNGIPLATTGVRVLGAGEAWGGALEDPVVRTIADICRRGRFSLRAIVPTVFVLGNSLEDARVVWRDGDVAAELSLSGRTLDGIRRLPIGSESGDVALTPRPPLRALGDEAWRFADAYAAALTADDEPVAVRPGRGDAHGAERAARWRLLAAAAALGTAALAALMMPGLVATRIARDAERELRALVPARAVAVRAEGDLRRVTAALEETRVFERSRRPALVFLAALADALPPTAQLVTVRLDSTGGSLVALAPRAGDALSGIERMADVAAPEIVGPVTREYVGPREKERVTIKFRWRAPATGGKR